MLGMVAVLACAAPDAGPGEIRFEEIASDPQFGKMWAVSAGWLDYDDDGWLDLFVSNYVAWDAASEPECGPRDGRFYCNPSAYRGLPNQLFHNNRDGTSTDVSRASGIAAHTGKGMGVAFADFDGDGFTDIFVANDSVRSFLFHNQKNGTSREIGVEAGVALRDDGAAIAGMGADFQDFDNDGLPDLVVSGMINDGFLLFRNLGRRRSGLSDGGAPSRSGIRGFRQRWPRGCCRDHAGRTREAVPQHHARATLAGRPAARRPQQPPGIGGGGASRPAGWSNASRPRHHQCGIRLLERAAGPVRTGEQRYREPDRGSLAGRRHAAIEQCEGRSSDRNRRSRRAPTLRTAWLLAVLLLGGRQGCAQESGKVAARAALDRANRLFGAHQYQESMNALDEALRLDPNLVAALAALLELAENQEQPGTDEQGSGVKLSGSFLELNGAPVKRQCLVRAYQGFVSKPQVERRLGIAGIQLAGFFKRRDRRGISTGRFIFCWSRHTAPPGRMSMPRATPPPFARWIKCRRSSVTSLHGTSGATDS
jgi:hypothetical protein